MKKFSFFFFLFLTFFTFSQNNLNYKKRPFYIGPGFGMDFGGFGGKMEYMFLDYGGLFFGAGYNLLGLGTNGGVMLKPLPKKQVTPYFLGMYGYTGVIKVTNADIMNKIDYGYSLGTGIEIKTKHLNAWQIGVVLPFRSQEFKDHYQSLKDNPNIDINAELLPISLSLGFKIFM